MTVPRSRMGKAWTEWKPAASASAAKLGPAAVDRGQVVVHDRLAGAVAVEAGAFLGLQLEQLQHAHGLAGRGHHPQVAVGRGQHEPGGADVEHLDAAVGQHGSAARPRRSRPRACRPARRASWPAALLWASAPPAH